MKLRSSIAAIVAMAMAMAFTSPTISLTLGGHIDVCDYAYKGSSFQTCNFDWASLNACECYYHKEDRDYICGLYREGTVSPSVPFVSDPAGDKQADIKATDGLRQEVL